jgi:hypothetical protein
MNYKEEAKHQLESKLNAVGLSIAEVKRQLNQFDASADVSKQDNQEFFDFFKSITKTPEASTSSCSFANCNCNPAYEPLQGDVSFLVGSTANSTKVYVGDVLMNGVIHAMLEYDADRELPVLHLEILAPKILPTS